MLGNNNIETDSKRLGGIFLIIGWVIFICMVGYLAHKVIFSPKTPTIQETYSGTQITIYRDFDSHFRISGSINGTPVTFLIDTGATSIAIPADIAAKAGLVKKAQVYTDTANGTAIAYLTKIEKLNIGPIELQDLSAVIAPSMKSDEALLGMNVLSKFHIEQTATTLVISFSQPSRLETR